MKNPCPVENEPVPDERIMAEAKRGWHELTTTPWFIDMQKAKNGRVVRVSHTGFYIIPGPVFA